MGSSVCKWKHIEPLILSRASVRRLQYIRASEDLRGYKVHVGCVCSYALPTCAGVGKGEIHRTNPREKKTKHKNENKWQKIVNRRPTQNFIRQYHSSHICHLSFIKLLYPLYKLFMPLAKCIHTILFTLLLHFYSALFPTFVYKNKSLL